MGEQQLHLDAFLFPRLKTFDLKENIKYSTGYNKRLSEYYE